METQADELREALEMLPAGELFVWAGHAVNADGERDRPVHATKVAAEGPSDAFEVVAQKIAGYFDHDHGPDGSYPVSFDWDAPNGDQWASDAMASLSESQKSVDVEFYDGSSHQLNADPARQAAEREALDAGVALLEPVTADEIRGVERILSVLEAAVSNDALTDFQERRILAMAEVIREARNDADAGETERWKLVGPVRTALRYVGKDAPRNVVAWSKLAKILADIEWTDLANSLPL